MSIEGAYLSNCTPAECYVYNQWQLGDILPELDDLVSFLTSQKEYMMSKNWPLTHLIFFIMISLTIIGCGTDIKPSAFLDVVRDGNDIDSLSECISEEPKIDNKRITIALDKQCLVDFSQQDRTDPNLAPSYAEILEEPEMYMDKLLTFEAVVKKIHNPHHIELYTNDLDLRFYIHTHGAPLYRLDKEGKQVQLDANQKYRFKIRIFELKRHADWGRTWEINAEFIVSTNKQILHPPELIVE